MTTRWARVLRSQLISAFATFTAAFSHGFADGAHPPLFAVALGLAFSGLACVALLAVRMSQLSLGASIAVSQLFYHGLFTVFGADTGASGGVTQPHHHGAIVFSPVAGDIGAQATAADVWMLFAHLGAAVLTFAVVVHGERLAAAVAAVTRMAITTFAWLGTGIPEPARLRFSQPTGVRSDIPHRDLTFYSALRHRGPPTATRFA